MGPGEGGTVLTFEINFTVPVPVLGRLAERIVVNQLGREYEVAPQNVKDLMEA